jgi:cation diffusion facilitator family transporter
MKSYERFRLHIPVEEAAHGTAVVVVAFVANVLVAISKTVAGWLTGSSSMWSEAVHSWVDVGNEAFVVAANHAARKPADPAHPMGHGRASYVWSLLASLGTLAFGALVGVWQGIHELRAPAHDDTLHYEVGYIVLAVALVLEGASFVQTLRHVRRRADELGRRVLEHAVATSDSPVRAVLAEDFTALLGICAAALGMLLHQLTGKAAYDAFGSIAIGVLMAGTALFLVIRNVRFLASQSVPPADRRNLLSFIRAAPHVSRVTFLYTEFIGPERCLVIAGVGISGERSQAELAAILRGIERRLMERPYIGLAIMTLATAEDSDLEA